MNMDDEQPVMAEQNVPMVYRNHPSVILKNILRAAIIMAFVILVNIGNFRESGVFEFNYSWILAGLILFGVLVFIFWRRWMLTTFTFGASEIVVDRNTLFKNKVNIQYSRLASVNVKRTVINHIFGTTDLLFNVNSSVNSMAAEAVLTLRSEEADALRETISSKILNRTMVVKEEKALESLVEVSNADIILHGLFGQPTSTSIFGLASLTYSIVTIFWGNGTGIIPALILFFVSSLVPWVRTILRYSNYRIYRVGDTVTVESGLINNYRSSFQLKKVNSVRIRQPLLARFLGKALLEAEVVGLADTDGMPLLCPLKNKNEVLSLGKTIVPEFIFDHEENGQPKDALVPTLAYKLALSFVFIIAGIVGLIVTSSTTFDKELAKYSCYTGCSTLIVLIPAILMIHGMLAQTKRGFAMDKDVFMFLIGGYDLETNYIRYDKVQRTVILSGPIQRMFGVSSCEVSMMSSAGAKSIRSGIFARSDLEMVPKEIMDRIKDGRYDYRAYE